MIDADRLAVLQGDVDRAQLAFDQAAAAMTSGARIELMGSPAHGEGGCVAPRSDRERKDEQLAQTYRSAERDLQRALVALTEFRKTLQDREDAVAELNYQATFQRGPDEVR